MVDMDRAIKVIRQLRDQLENWVEIADEDDLRAEDDHAIIAANQFLTDAGVEPYPKEAP